MANIDNPFVVGDVVKIKGQSQKMTVKSVLMAGAELEVIWICPQGFSQFTHVPYQCLKHVPKHEN
jgi:uncharacterized protein YodC (DUF2158 family)